MSIIAENKGGNYKVIEAGVYPARCYSMIDLGTQELTYNGETKHIRQVVITWELPTELAVFHEEKGEEPYAISKTYTLSMHEKAGLRKDLESWRGKSFTDEEAKAFDITKLLGKPCQISIIHKQSADGSRTYANISSITSLMKGVEVPPQINPTRELTFMDFNWNVFKDLPQWMREIIVKSPEYNSLASANETRDEEPQEEKNDLPF